MTRDGSCLDLDGFIDRNIFQRRHQPPLLAELLRHLTIAYRSERRAQVRIPQLANFSSPTSLVSSSDIWLRPSKGMKQRQQLSG